MAATKDQPDTDQDEPKTEAASADVAENAPAKKRKPRKKAAAKSSGPKLTPMMERYMEVKSQNPGSLLLFRMGNIFRSCDSPAHRDRYDS